MEQLVRQRGGLSARDHICESALSIASPRGVMKWHRRRTGVELGRSDGSDQRGNGKIPGSPAEKSIADHQEGHGNASP